MSLRTTPATRFDSFDYYTTFYKKIRDHEIEAVVLVPKDLKPGKHPLYVKWHGGGLTTGTGAYPDWFPAYLIPLIIQNNAITVLPNYRLVPEHTGDDILTDISDFWTWIRDSLPAYISSKNPSVNLDLSRILISGDSAGAWCALQSVFTQPEHTFKACLVQYPVLCAISTDPNELMCGDPVPPKEVLEKELAAIVPGTIISSATPPARDWTAPMLRAYGRWAEFFGEGKHLWPLTRLDDAEYFVPMYVIHGDDDTNVPVEWSREFVEKAKKKFPRRTFEIVTPPGDHGFDTEMYEEDEEWLGKIMGKVREEWLG